MKQCLEWKQAAAVLTNGAGMKRTNNYEHTLPAKGGLNMPKAMQRLGGRKKVPPAAATLTQKQTAAHLGVSPQKFQQMVAVGEAPPFLWLGGSRRWRPTTVSRWIEQQEAEVARLHRAVTR